MRSADGPDTPGTIGPSERGVATQFADRCVNSTGAPDSVGPTETGFPTDLAHVGDDSTAIRPPHDHSTRAKER